MSAGTEPFLGIVLTYHCDSANPPERRIEFRPPAPSSSKLNVGVLGAGNFARMVLLPAIGKCENLHRSVLCSAGGVSAAHTGDKLQFDSVTTDESTVFDNPAIRVVFSLTRHDQHARHVLAAIARKQAIFVEKPLCLSIEELAQIEESLAAAGNAAPLIMVGFNRRFSPAAATVKQFFARVDSPLTVSIRFNAGSIPAEDWTQNDDVGGGRIVGEACHGIDLATFLVGSPVVRVYAESVGGTGAPAVTDDQCFITLRHANGSISNIAYLAGGDKSFPKERIEVFGGGQIAVIDDFRTVSLCSKGKTQTTKLRSQDKGHAAEIQAFADALAGKAKAPISWQELRSTTLASLLAVRSLREGFPFELD